MNIWYNGIQIADKADVHSVTAADYAGGRADSMTAAFADVKEVWPHYSAKFGDTLRAALSEYDTGDMYISRIRQTSGLFELTAVSVPPEARDAHDQAWEKVTLPQLAQEFAGRYGLSLMTIDVPDHTYERLRQHGSSDFAWLAHRCMLESCALKVHNGSMVVYYEPSMEAKDAVRAIGLGAVEDFDFDGNSHVAYKACSVVGAKAKGTYTCSESGGTLTIKDIPVGSIGEAERFAKGVLRANNKRLYTMPVIMKQDCLYAAGEIVEVSSTNTQTAGRWFVEQVTQDLTGETTRLLLRRPLEGY